MPNMTQAQIDAFLAEQKRGYMNPETGEWISQSTGSYVDPVTKQQFSLLNNSGAQQSAYGDGVGMYIGGDSGITPMSGGTYNIYDAKGADTGRTGQYSDSDFSWVDEAMLAMVLAGAGAAVGGAAGFGANPVTGAMPGGAGGAAGAAGGGLGTMGAGAGEIGTMGTLDLLPTTMGQFELPGLMSTVGGAAGGAGGAGAAGSSLMNGVKNYGGLLSAAAGALAGSQGQKNSTTSTRDMHEYLKPYVVGQDGLLDKTKAHFLSQVAAMPQYTQQLNNVSQGLLSGATRFGRG